MWRSSRPTTELRRLDLRSLVTIAGLRSLAGGLVVGLAVRPESIDVPSRLVTGGITYITAVGLAGVLAGGSWSGS